MTWPASGVWTRVLRADARVPEHAFLCARGTPAERLDFGRGAAESDRVSLHMRPGSRLPIRYNSRCAYWIQSLCLAPSLTAFFVDPHAEGL